MALCHVASFIARIHANYIRGKANKITHSPGLSACRILCLDLDLEAPGVPAFFPPQQDVKVKGFLGLLHEYFENKAKWTESERIIDFLHKSLGENLEDYAYKVQETENLFVLPSGHVNVLGASRVRRELHEHLAAMRETDSKSIVHHQYVPLFSELKTVLRELFDYTFVDARTGLSDTAYATTIALADSMVFLFRPNVTQLMGIQDVFGRFLRQRNLSLDHDKQIPAIPVLSPRPSYSTPRLNEVRKVAAKRVFRWLEKESKSSYPFELDPYAPEMPKLIELPFDSSMEIGERLMIPPSPDAELEDIEAPLYKGYVELALEIQKRNAKRDVLGARGLEQQHWKNNNKVEAINCLLASVAREPDYIDTWKDIWNGYSDELSTSTPIQNRVLDFCDEARKFPLDRPIPRFFGTLWKSEICENLAPSVCSNLISELWPIAVSTLHIEMIEYALMRMYRWYSSHENQEALPNCPSWPCISAGQLLADLTKKLDPDGLLKVLNAQSAFYSSKSSSPDDTVEFYMDQLTLTASEHNRAVVLSSLANTHVRNADFYSAYKAYTTAVQLSSCPSWSEKRFIAFQMRFLPPESVEAAIQAVLTPQLQPNFSMLLEIRKLSNIETVRQKLERIKKFNSAIADDPNFEFYSLMHHRRFQEAAEIMGKSLGKVKDGVGISELTKLRLAQWLEGRANFDSEISNYARARITSPNLDIDEPESDICLALSACLDATSLEVRRRLQQPQWPIARFGWTLVSCICDANIDLLLPKMRQSLEENPLLAAWFRKHEDWPLFRFIIERHRNLGNIDDASFRRRIDVIDLIESTKVDFAPPDPIPLPKIIISSDDPRFIEIVERWKRKLAWIREDRTMGPVVDKLIEHVIGSDNKGTSS